MERLREILRMINGSPSPAAVYKIYKPEIVALLRSLQADLTDDYGSKGRPLGMRTKDIKLSARIHTPEARNKPLMTPEEAISKAWGNFLSGANK